MEKEKFSSRLGFILIAAGCAIGVGNVYKFPIWTGAYGGGIFVLIYLIFLLLLGLPVMTAELSVGRASGRSIASSFEMLEPKGSKWHLWQYVGIAANYALMMAYTQIAGFFALYFGKYVIGSVCELKTVEELSAYFVNDVATDLPSNVLGMYIAVLAGLGVCALGLQKGVEKITKVMMVCLFVLLCGLAIYSLTLPGAAEGLKFYLVPSLERAESVGWGTVLSSAMSQAFFTLSLGIGSIAIFGASIGKDRSLLGESATIIGLDTFVALTAGLFLFPAYFTFNPGGTIDDGSANASFLFATISSVFNNMEGGRILGILFFLFMVFAAFSTVIAVMENIVNFWLEKTKLSRAKICAINIVMFAVLCLPTAFATCGTLGFDKLLIFGRTFDGFLDFFVSNLCLPIGCFVYTLFCVSKKGWGWNAYFEEVNAGKGAKLPKWLKPYMTYVVPVIIFAVLVMGLLG